MDSDQSSKKQNKHLGILFVISFLNLIGFGIIIPLLPYYAETFGASPVDVGLLIGAYAAAQFIGSPLWGRYSDKYGRRPALMLTISGAVIGYLILGEANSLFLLFFSRIISGFMNGNISVAQAFVADLTDLKERAKGLGIIGAAFGLGFILGPALGGFLANWGYAVPAYGAAVLNLLNLVAVYYWLPESHPPEKRNKHQAGSDVSFSLKALRLALVRPLVGALLQTRFVFGLAFSTFTTVFAIYAQHSLGLTAQSTAYILTYVGVLIVLVQGVVIGRLTAVFGEGRLLFHSVVLMALSLIAWAFVKNVPMLLLIMPPLALASGVFNTVINSSLSKAVSEEEIGGMLGISASLESFSRIIAPLAGGITLDHFGSWAPGLLSSVLLGLIIPYAWKNFIRNPHPSLRRPGKVIEAES